MLAQPHRKQTHLILCNRTLFIFQNNLVAWQIKWANYNDCFICIGVEFVVSLRIWQESADFRNGCHSRQPFLPFTWFQSNCRRNQTQSLSKCMPSISRSNTIQWSGCYKTLFSFFLVFLVCLPSSPSILLLLNISAVNVFLLSFCATLCLQLFKYLKSDPLDFVSVAAEQLFFMTCCLGCRTSAMWINKNARNSVEKPNSSVN